MRSFFAVLLWLPTSFLWAGEVTFAGRTPKRSAPVTVSQCQNGLDMSLKCAASKGPLLTSGQQSVYHLKFESIKDIPQSLAPYVSSEVRSKMKYNFQRLDPSKDGAVDIFLVCENDNPLCGMLFSTMTALGVDKKYTEPLNGHDKTGKTFGLKAVAGRAFGKDYYSVMYLTEANTAPFKSADPGAENIQGQNFQIETLLGVFVEKAKKNNVTNKYGIGFHQVDAENGDNPVGAGGLQELVHDVVDSVAGFSRKPINNIANGDGKRTSMFFSVESKLEHVFSTYDSHATYDSKTGKLKTLKVNELRGQAGAKAHIVGLALEGNSLGEASYVEAHFGLTFDRQKSLGAPAYRWGGGVYARYYPSAEALEVDVKLGMTRATKNSNWNLGAVIPVRMDDNYIRYKDDDVRWEVRRNWFGLFQPKK